MKDKRQSTGNTGGTATPVQNAGTTKKGGGAIGALALVAALGAGGFSGYLWTELQNMRAETDSVVTSTTDQLRSGIQADVEAVRSSLSNTTGELSSKLDALGQSIDAKTQAAVTEVASNTASAVQELTTNTENQFSALSEQLEQTNTRLDETRSELDQQLQENLNALQQNVDTSISTLAADVAETRDLATRSQTEWILAETEYLLRMAGHRVNFAGDTKAGILALRAASVRLHDLGDSRFAPVREQIANEVAELRQTGAPDIEGIALELQKMSQRADSLPLPKSSIQKSFDEAKSSPTAENAKQVAGQLLQSLKGMVKVEPADGIPVIRPSKPTREQLSASESLRLHLQAARLAVLRRDQETYREHLDNATSYVNNSYDTEDPVTQAYLEDLAALKAQTILPDAGKLGQALALFTEINAKRGEAQ
ncbi:uroporphyrinogen-III C-methyltransferase [Granulosicoccaceae sp. 1_MG-2023]|nr:uroporphyrinogen-III C-methyltransferase [Granulosicoccaceae sp. 1_MG-2023]